MREFLFRNMSLKLLSLIFAISLWLFVNLKATAERTLQIPVRWENMPSFLQITNEVNDSVRVRVSGPRRILSHLDPSRFPVTLDLSDAKVGLSDYQINEKMIHLPPGLTATVLPPDTIQFKFDLTVTKAVAVRVPVAGRPAEGYEIRRVEAKPARIDIVGAQSEVQALSEVETEPVDVGGKTATFTTRARIVLKQPHVRPAAGQESVEIRIVIAALPRPIEPTGDHGVEEGVAPVP